MFTRFVCDGGVEVRAEGSRGFWGTLSDICAGGCYVQSFQPMSKGTQITFLIKAKGMELQGSGAVVAQHPGVGMAVHFTHFSAEEQKKLDLLLAQLERENSTQSGAIVTQ